MENVKDNYWTEIYDTITNYNERNHTPLSNANIREAIDKVILEEQAEEDNATVDTFSPQRNKSDDLIENSVNLTINNKVGDNLIDKVANFTINN